MIGLIQRVSRAEVRVEGKVIASIGMGLAALVCVERDDQQLQARRLGEKLLDYRVFSDKHGRLMRSLRQTEGGLLLVPQFTLAADTSNGLRPNLGRAAGPRLAAPLFSYLVEFTSNLHEPVVAGKFGARMDLELVNEGPLTFWLQIPAKS